MKDAAAVASGPLLRALVGAPLQHSCVVRHKASLQRHSRSRRKRGCAALLARGVAVKYGVSDHEIAGDRADADGAAAALRVVAPDDALADVWHDTTHRRLHLNKRHVDLDGIDNACFSSIRWHGRQVRHKT